MKERKKQKIQQKDCVSEDIKVEQSSLHATKDFETTKKVYWQIGKETISEIDNPQDWRTEIIWKKYPETKELI